MCNCQVMNNYKCGFNCMFVSNLPIATPVNMTVHVLALLYTSNGSSGVTVAFRQLYKSQNTYSRLSFSGIKCMLSYQRLLRRPYSKKYPQLLMQALLTQDQTGQGLRRARHNPRRCICAWETGGEREGKNTKMKVEGRTGCRQQWSGCFLTVTEHRKCSMMWTVTLEFLQR